VLGGEAPRVEQLASLPLLEHVLKESLRLFPPAPMNHRVTSHDTELGGFVIPRGSEVLSSAYHTHRDPEFFPDPERFVPARWQGADPGPYTFSPFGAAHRMCIGAAFAMMELKLVLAILLQRFRFELVPGQRLDRAISIVMSPSPGLYLRVFSADRAFTASSGPRRGNVWKMVRID
jgi:cytochrome P450